MRWTSLVARMGAERKFALSLVRKQETDRRDASHILQLPGRTAFHGSASHRPPSGICGNSLPRISLLKTQRQPSANLQRQY